jgi:hypothetical protein
MSDGQRHDRSVLDARAGLCASCRHAEMVTSSRGSTFYLCRLANSDPRFVKYPALPVFECAGYGCDVRTN